MLAIKYPATTTPIRLVINSVVELLNNGNLRFIINSTGETKAGRYVVPIAEAESLSQAAELITRFPSFALDFERTAFGDYFGVVALFEERQTAEACAEAFKVPTTAIRGIEYLN